MSKATDKADSLLATEVVYDGAGYSRENLQSMLGEYQAKHQTNLKTLAELSKAHDDLAAEMTQDLVEQKRMRVRAMPNSPV